MKNYKVFDSLFNYFSLVLGLVWRVDHSLGHIQIQKDSQIVKHHCISAELISFYAY